MKAVKNVTLKQAFFQTLHHSSNSPKCQRQLFSFTSQNGLDFIISRKIAKDKMCFCGSVYLDHLIWFNVALLAESSWIPHHKIVTVSRNDSNLFSTLHFNWHSAGILGTRERWGLWGEKTTKQASARAVIVQNRGFRQPRLKRQALVHRSTYSAAFKTADLKIIRNF